SGALPPIPEAKPGYEIIETIAERLASPLYESGSQRKEEIKQLMSTKGIRELPAEYIEVQPALPEPLDEYPVPLFVGDDPHHSGYWTEKANSLVNFRGEAYIEISPSLANEYDFQEGDSVRVESRVGKIIVPVRISDYIRNGVAFIPRNFSSTAVTSLLMRKQRIDWVKLSKVVS
ncbi:hypothetical protein GF377_07430, partial [candidate division GN15 bacterium]|nr:hypothetical protein [candidate division GN15 bacterium]